MPNGQDKNKNMKLNVNHLDNAGDSVAASLVGGVIAAALAEGIEIHQQLALLGLDVEVLANATQRVELAVFRALLQSITEHSKDDAIGIRIGRHLSISSFNALGHAAASSEILSDALQLIPQFESTIMTVGRTELLQEGSDVKVCWSMKSGGYLYILEDIFLSCWISLAKLITGHSGLVVEVSFTHPKPDDLSSWQEMLGCSLLFDQGIAGVKFDKTLLNLAIQKPDPFLHRIMTKEVEGLSLALNDSLSCQIEQWLESQLIRGEPEQKILAEHLNMSERTLRRYLKNENTSFIGLLKKVRTNKANYLLQSTSLSLWEISSQLGYQQLTTFNAAYKRWTGNTPASQRK